MLCSSRCVAKLCLSVCGGNPLGQPSQLGSHVADAIELACGHRVDAVAAGEHPHRGTCDAPPVAQQLQQLWRQHCKAILAAFALLHPDHHALGINIADLQRDDLHGSQTSAVGNAERRLVLGPGCRLQEPQHLIRGEHARQLARLVDKHEMARRLRPVERHFEEEPERGHGRVDGRWPHTSPGEMQLERAQLFRARAVGGPAEEGREPLDGADVLALRIGRESADAHVLEHPLAQRADGLLAHSGLLS